MSSPYINQKIGRKIKILRKDKKLTQIQLSDELSIHPKHLSNIENGRKAVTIALLEKLCNVFNKPLVYFFDFSEYKEDASDSKIINTIIYLLKTMDTETKQELLQIADILSKRKNKNL